MQTARKLAVGGLAAAGAISAVAVAAASPTAGGPPPPKAASGAKVDLLAGPGAVPTPTSFAFGKGTVFVGSGSGEGGKNPPRGGVFAVKGGKATLVPKTPKDVFGVAWKGGKLYVSGVKELLVYGGWNGTKFASRKVLLKAPKGLPGFNGLAFGPNGRLYSGASLNPKYDHKADPAEWAQSILSVKPNGKDLQKVASGLRQPFQLAFVKGQKDPYVSVLAQDKPAKTTAPDYIVQAKSGQDYGFAKCTWVKPKKCKGYARPKKLLSVHTSPMGLGTKGHTLYIAEFGKQRVVKMALKSKKVSSVLTGFAAPVIGLGVHGGYVYVGDLTGSIYRSKI